jgi:hypothetical protein
VFLLASTARAGGADPQSVTEAREEFVRGTEAGKRAQWSEALVFFEHSAKLRPHSVTTFNVGVCQRALGQYTLARDTLLAALAQNEASGGKEMADALIAENRGYVAQIDDLLVTAHVTIEPAAATIAVDGRPLARRGEGEAELMVAGVREPGRGEEVPRKDFRLKLNPGVHVFTLARAGFADAVITRTMTPGSRPDLKIELDRLPATIRITSNQDGAIVTLDDRDLGATPVEVSRPAGSYRVSVNKSGFKRYDSKITVTPGQNLDLSASLAKQETSILERWWFWTIAGAVVVGAGVGTYALTRSESTTQEPVNGGGLGWAVKLH